MRRVTVRRVATRYIDLPALKRVTAGWMLLLATASVAFAQNDTVTTATGETIIGEIISVQKDVLTMSTPIRTPISRSSGTRWSRWTAPASS